MEELPMDLGMAAAVLSEDGCTVVAVKDRLILTDERRGVMPLLDWIDSGEDLGGAAIADKVVGKGPALLYCLMGVKDVFAPVMSVDAIQVLNKRDIGAYCDEVVDWITNRAGDGRCPIDSSVVETEDPEEALGIIRDTASKLAG